MALTRRKAPRKSKPRASSSTISKSLPESQSRVSNSTTSKSVPVEEEQPKRPKNPAACLSGIAAELRSEIFKIVFTRATPLKLLKSGDRFIMMSRQQHVLQPGILALCKTFLHEAAPSLYGENIFSVTCRHVPEFLDSIGEANAKLLRRFRVFPDRDLSWALKPILRCPRLKEIQLESHMVAAERLVRTLLPHAVKRAKTKHTSLVKLLSFAPEPAHAVSLALGDDSWREEIEKQTEAYAEEVLNGLRDCLALKGLPSPD